MVLVDNIKIKSRTLNDILTMVEDSTNEFRGRFDYTIDTTGRANVDDSLIITGNGDVIEPPDGLMAIGSGGPFAQSAAMALLDNSDLSANEIVVKSLNIAADICIYTNHNQTIEELDSK